MRLLFVCSGNICRSPMAAEYARDRLARSGLSDVIVDSAGTLGIEGERACPEAVRVLREAGFDLAGHRSRGLREEDLRSADLVIAMARSHLEEIGRDYRAPAVECRLLRAFEKGATPRGEAPDLEDPIGRPVEIYRECFELIRTCVDHLLAHLKQGS